MQITFAPRGILQIDDARITHRNLEGRASQYNRAGDRNFSLVIPDKELAEKLLDMGWNVKIKAPREDGEEPFMFLPVKVKFNDRGPGVYLASGNNTRPLDEESVAMLDRISISRVDLDIRPYDWVLYEGTKNEKRGRTAYLQGMSVTQNIDRFAARFAEEEGPEEESLPF